MSTIRAYLGVSGLGDVGYQFYTQNTGIGSRVTAGVTDEGGGWYSVAGVTLQGDHVRWDSTGTPTAVAREDLAVRLLLESMPVTILTLDWTTVTGEASFSVLQALRMLRNQWQVASSVLTVKKEDGSTTAWTRTVESTPGADPVTGLGS